MAAIDAKPGAPLPRLQLGQFVQFVALPERRGQIVELRGPLGPGGAQIYRVRYGTKRNHRFVEVREDQLELITIEANGKKKKPLKKS